MERGVIEKNERLRALKTVLVVLCGRAMDHLVTSTYWTEDNGDLWRHLKSSAARPTSRLS